MVPKVTMHASKGGEQSALLPRYDDCELTTDQYANTTIRVQEWHAHFAGNQQLSNYTQGSFKKREIMPGTRNLTIQSRLVKSWSSRKNYDHNFTETV